MPTTGGKRVLGQATRADQRPVDLEETRLRRDELSLGVEVPEPPFWGPRVLARVPVDALVPFLNERMLYRSEEHTSELQSIMRSSYAVFCLKKKNTIIDVNQTQT